MPRRLVMALKTSAASASCGTARGLTNEVTSITGRPAADSRSTKRTFTVVGTVAEMFCKPSRGPTSTTRTRAGSRGSRGMTWGHIYASSISTSFSPAATSSPSPCRTARTTPP